MKVKLANKLYAFTRRVIDKCVQLDIPFICENPLRSWMWSTSFFRQLHVSCIFQVIHSCMYGGQRLKKTRFLMNFIADNLKRECDGRHQHLPWGKTLSKETGQQVFSTSTEAEYPWQLCKQLAFAFFFCKCVVRAKFLSRTAPPWMSTSGWEQVLNLEASWHRSFYQNLSSRCAEIYCS